jgi:hypothetical protein
MSGWKGRFQWQDAIFFIATSLRHSRSGSVPWELVRWKGPAGEPMRIVFEWQGSVEHVSVNDAAVPDVSRFLHDDAAGFVLTDKIPRPPLNPERPVIVCLCGSTRFCEAFHQANLSETLAGRIVLTVGCDFKSDEALGLSTAVKERLDELHKRKIDLADEILVLNVGGYIGASTHSEIQYAVGHGKKVRFLEMHHLMETKAMLLSDALGDR